MFSPAYLLRCELTLRARAWAKGLPHAESYGANPVVVFAPDGERHGNFLASSYASICKNQKWLKRFNKIHAQGRALPRPEDPARRWRELDSSMSSDALLMNILCCPEVIASERVRSLLGIAAEAAAPEFGFRARVPLANAHFDRTEVDLIWGDLLAEAKLTEAGFQTARPELVLSYRDLNEVFDVDRLPTVALPAERQRMAAEFPEDYSQEEVRVAPEDWEPTEALPPRATTPGFESYQLIRNVLAAHALGKRFAVFLDERRPDLIEAWFRVLAAVRTAELRTRLLVLTWQELSAVLPEDLRRFLDLKYGIAAAGRVVSAVPGTSACD